MTDFEPFSAEAFTSTGIRSWSAMARQFQENLRLFAANNSLRIKEMMRYGTSGVRTAFQKIPLFLQMNDPNVPGYVSGCEGSIGIAGFERSGFARVFLKQHPDRCLREILVRYPCIQSLTLIGSCGSIGHTRFSDLDYWVCVDPDVSPAYKPHLLAQKLRKISDWAAENHGLEVHFFLMNVSDVRANFMGALDEDSSGDVMPSLLKEEFYRTLLHVAGRIPLWWAMPAGIDDITYRHIAEDLSSLDVTAFNPHDCLDLGYPHLPGPRELLGAAMWQTYKSIRDPFKAIIKMVLVLEEVDSDLKAPLLCEQVKEALFRAEFPELPVDPYWHTRPTSGRSHEETIRTIGNWSAPPSGISSRIRMERLDPAPIPPRIANLKSFSATGTGPAKKLAI